MRYCRPAIPKLALCYRHCVREVAGPVAAAAEDIGCNKRTQVGGLFVTHGVRSRREGKDIRAPEKVVCGMDHLFLHSDAWYVISPCS